MTTDDAVERIIACARKADIGDGEEWVGRHKAQAFGEMDMDEVELPDGEAFCVAYTPDVDLQITAPDHRPYGDELRETLRDVVLKSDYGRVGVPARTGCDPVFGDHTDLPVYDSEIGDPYHMAYTTVCIPPADWLRIQYQLSYGTLRDVPSFEAWMSDTSTKRLGEIRDSISAGDRQFPRPVLEHDRHGRLMSRQEGRHRGVAAWEEDVPYLDVYVMANNKVNRGVPHHEWNEPPEFEA